MKTNGTRRIVTFMLALVLVFTTVCVGTTEVEAAEKFTTIIAPTQTEQATAGTEVKTPFSLTKSYGFVAQIVTEAPVDMTITVYDSVGNKVQRADNPYQISSSSTSWEYEEGVYYFVDPVPNVDAGDYYYGITFSQSTKYLLYMYQYNGGAKISNANALLPKDTPRSFLLPEQR